jgi:outer membrane protein OmpA-like peptidoglycan-associated protein
MKKILLSALAVLSVTTAVQAHDYHDAVRDYQGDVILNTWDNCVVTKWSSGDYGCENSPETVFASEMLNVYFNFDSSVLTPAAKSKLEQVVELLGSATNVQDIDIIGYADYLGDVSYNQALSERRAAAVKAYLESLGYYQTRNVQVRALGEDQPITDCEGLDGQQLKACLWRDRRVELKLNYVK